MPPDNLAPRLSRRRRLRTAAGLYLVVAAVYVLSSPGRIDSIDGLIRFDVTRSLVDIGRPVLRDPLVSRWGTLGPDGAIYAKYGAGASIAAYPLVLIGSRLEDPLGETRRFLFSLTTPLLGAGIAPLLFLFYLQLGVAARSATLWALGSSFATLLWPASTTVLDQAQHAFFLFLALFLGFLAARKDSYPLAAAGGFAAGLVLNYLESYVLLFPFLALATLGGDASRERKKRRLLIFLAATAGGLALWMLYNWVCFRNPFIPSKLRAGFFGHPSVERNVLSGIAGLLLSPGKSVFLYSPTLVVGLLGFRGLWQRAQWLAASVPLASVIHLAFTASMTFWHGDWCWGPRYLVILLPLWALAFPFATCGRRRRRWVAALVVLGILVQLLGLATVHERFFFERGLETFFWAADPLFYFHESALLARPLEVWSSLSGRLAERAVEFSNGPYPRSVTYIITAFPDAAEAPELMRRFKVFYLPRPWPLWLPRLDPQRYALPIQPAAWTAALLVAAALGAAFLLPALRRRDPSPC